MASKTSEISLRGLKAVSNGALSAEKLPSRIKILDWGTNESTQGPVILDETSAKVFTSAQKTIGRETVALDFEHNTVPGTDAYKESGEPRNVAAYGVPNIVNGEGLFLDNLQWTPAGLSSARNYIDLSPTPFLIDGRVVGLHSAALTRAGSVADLTFFSTGGVETDIQRLATLSMPAPELPKDFPPLETRENVLSALAFVNAPRHFKTFSAGILPIVKAKLSEAINKFEIPTSVEPTTGLPIYDSAKTFSTKPIMTSQLVALRAALKLPETATETEILDAASVKVAVPAPATQNQTIDIAALNAGFKTMLDAAVTPLAAKVTALNTELENKDKAAAESERARLIALASSEGKVIPFSEATLKTLSVPQLTEMISGLPKNRVALTAKARTTTAGKAEAKPTALEAALNRKPSTFSSEDGMTAFERTAANFQMQVERIKENQLANAN